MPDRKTCRLFYQHRDDYSYRCIAWFQLSGHDFYWGPAAPGPDVEVATFSGTTATIRWPEDLERLPQSNWYASRHQSGQFHINSGGNRWARDEYVGKIQDLAQPKLIAALIDKHPHFHPRYTRSITRSKGAAIVVRVSESAWHARHYFEFFLTPPGTHRSPRSLLAGSDFAQTPFILQPFGPDLDILLAIRHGILPADSRDSRTMNGIWFNLT